jgi:NADPH:quinone reductase-like Zn-dependent oxidoreductase
LPAWQVIKKPAGLDLKQAAALPVNFLTAYIAINDITRVRSGDNVLLDCASGGVGVMAMQILSKLGANTIGLTSSPQKKEFIESYGAQAITWDEFENNQTKFDVVLNSSGGKTLMDHFSRLRKSGHLVCFGVSAGIKDGKRSWLRILKLVFDMPRFHILKLLQNNKSIGGLNVLYYFDDHEWMKSTITEIEKCDFIPHVDSVFAYKDVSKAHKWIETKKAKGKVLLDWTELHL